jgi:hypothetical protein
MSKRRIRQQLSNNIIELVLGGYEVKLNILFSYSILNKVIINLNIFVKSMKNQINRQMSSIQVVTPNNGDITRTKT